MCFITWYFTAFSVIFATIGNKLTGLKDPGSVLTFPFPLYIGTNFAIFHFVANTPFSKDRLIMCLRGLCRYFAPIFIEQESSSSCPTDVLFFIEFRSFNVSSSEIFDSLNIGKFSLSFHLWKAFFNVVRG